MLRSLDAGLRIRTKGLDMYRFKIIVIAMFLCILPEMQTQAQSEDKVVVDNNTGTPTIAVTNLDITDKTLKLSYEIRNDSGQDIWILLGFGTSDASVDLFIDKDERTLLIRRRFDVPFSGGGNIAPGRYVVMRNGETQIESVSLPVPVNPEYEFINEQTRQAQGIKYATRLAIEISYYDSDLPVRIRHTLEEADRIGKKPKNDDDRMRRFYFAGSLVFNSLNEFLRQRDEEILVPYTYQWFKGEKALRTVVEDVRIPYKERDVLSIKRYLPDLTRCTRAEIQYQPSMLEYFFPYPSQQSLLSPTEIKYLRSGNTIVVQDQKDLMTFVNNIKNGIPTSGGIVRERTTAQVVCYHDDEPPTYFPIYNDHSVVVDLKDQFGYHDGFPSLRTLTPQIEAFELRIQCAANLRNLWHRLRLYYKAYGAIKILYPAPTEWCDSMTRAYQSRGLLDRYINSPRPHKCPSAYEGKNHYAMNPNCKPDSPPDTVLLFETKAGWNQHGGPELFTFDNHDPRGGGVLFNDGTVKFIRTREELQQLRWK